VNPSTARYALHSRSSKITGKIKNIFTQYIGTLKELTKMTLKINFFFRNFLFLQSEILESRPKWK